MESLMKNMLLIGNDDNCPESVLSFCRTVLHSTISDDDIETAHRLSRHNLPSVNTYPGLRCHCPFLQPGGSQWYYQTTV